MENANSACATLELESAPVVVRTARQEKYPSKTFRRGQWVQIRSEAEIRATLDADGTLDGLQFMPEQVKYCGRKFRIYRRANRVYLDYHYYMVRLKNTVLLDDLRCDGSAHGGCQMKCLMFWKEAWLRPTSEPAAEEIAVPPVTLISLTNFSHDDEPERAEPKSGARYSCQATEMVRIGERVSGWDPRPFIGDVLSGERSIGETLTSLRKHAGYKLGRIWSRLRSRIKPPTPASKVSNPTGVPLNLQPGDWVEVKSLAEINETLNSENRLRGLGFSMDMAPFCGKRFRVTSRVERMILEWTGELKQLNDTVALDTVHCDGTSCQSCPRNCFFLWREDWLKRV
jgi:hypothetical protein